MPHYHAARLFYGVGPLTPPVLVASRGRVEQTGCSSELNTALSWEEVYDGGQGRKDPSEVKTDR